MELIDYFVVLAGSTIANAVFNHFEKHLSWWRRLAKLAAVLTVLALVGAALGRHAFYAALALLTIGQIILHAWWFPRHGLTAEPYDRYLKLMARVQHEEQ